MEIAENGGFFQRSKWVGWGNWDVKTLAAGDKNCSFRSYMTLIGDLTAFISSAYEIGL